MCGIVGYCGRKDAGNIILEGLKKLEYRGYDSSGISIIGESSIKTIKSVGKLNKLEENFTLSPISGKVGIGHTRWATHGEANLQNAHPHLNSKMSISIVHNGIIENYLDLKKELVDKGYEFKSNTDTEVIVQLIDYYFNGNILNAVLNAVKRLKGSYALGIISMENPSELIAVRNNSPLLLGICEDGLIISSEISSIVKHTNKVIYMDNLEIAQLDLNGNYKIFNYNLDEVEKEIKTMNLNLESISKNGFDHYMLKEIFEQPDAIRNVLNKRVIAGKINLSDNFFSKEEIEKFSQIYIIACGTAFHAGEIAKFAIQELTGKQVICEIASEFNYNQKFVDENTLAIFVSQSGETADTLLSINEVKKVGAKTMAIVNVENSTMAREVDKVLYCYCGPEISVASTKAYTTQLVILYLVALDIVLKLGKISEEKALSYVDELYTIPGKIEELLKDLSPYKEIAEEIKDEESAYYTGRGMDFTSAKEGSLKLKEISYIHTEAFASGELKHGSIALVEKGTKVLAISTQKHTLDKTASNLEELASRGATIYTITTHDNEVISKNSKKVIRIADTMDIFAPILSVVPSQLIAYYTSLAKGNDVDKPRNLAKAVTVE
ncbi:Glutamine-fructose-6-phosphate aminotransferase [Peptoniphilus sp. ING2-D1G]|nr:Glutamine-fructose-6-phosphate aminotransferase [Peptoniphilus sp. ING2-D1G]